MSDTNNTITFLSGVIFAVLVPEAAALLAIYNTVEKKPGYEDFIAGVCLGLIIHIVFREYKLAKIEAMIEKLLREKSE